MIQDKGHYQHGFSLLEVLIALAIVALTMTTISVSTGVFSTHKKLEETIGNLERALRFSSDEAAIRNRVIRLRLLLDKKPQEFVVEFGPDEKFIIPKSILEQTEASSLSEIEELQKEKKDINKKFSKVDEFQEDNFILNEDIKIVSIGSKLHKKIITEGEFSLYFFPTGEKDSAIIFLGTDEEMAHLSNESFTNDTDKRFILRAEVSADEDYLEAYQKEAKDIFEAWLKN